MKNPFEPFIKLISLMVALLVIVAAFTTLTITGILFIYQGGSLPQLKLTTGNSAELVSEDASISLALMSSEGMWAAPNWDLVEEEANADLIKYGKELVANTAEYLGPNGKVKKISNGMNCQNCHLNAGTAPLGNNYSGVAANYPKVRARSGQSEDIPKRINDCFERSFEWGRTPR
jgi:Cytochrome c